MPLTPAEKMKRYREKLKKDPIKYEQYKKKDLNRIKLKNKKVTELSEKEKADQRKKWREQKKRQKAKKAETASRKTNTENNISESERPTTSNEASTTGIRCLNKNHLLTIRRLRRMYEKAVNNNNHLHKNIQTLRKRCYRLKLESSKRIDALENKVLKMKAREEVMESALQTVYKSKSRKEKRILKSIAETDIVNRNKCKTFVANLLGLKGRVRVLQRMRTLQSVKIKEELKSFFIRDDISRSTSGKKECKTVNKEKHQIRYLTDKLFNLYQIYKNEGGRFSFITFFRYKPAYILSPNIHNRDTCLCIKHSNMNMLFSSLLRNKAFPQDIKSLTDVIVKLSCDSNTYDCMYGTCTICNQSKLIYALEGEALSKNVYWERWERIDHTYEKIEQGKLKKLITKKTVKNRKEGTLGELIQIFENNLLSYKIHVCNWKHQQREYRKKITNLEPDEALILCDFSENYECKLSEEIQATHFGASKNQITLHCGMIYWASDSQSFCSVSDSKCHEPSAIWAHLLPVIDLLKTKCPKVKRLHFFSDGPSSQYRQKKNFFLLNYYTKNLGLELSTWNFSESGHGKGVADGIGGSVKRTLDKQVAYGRDIITAKDAFEMLQSISKSIQFFFIEDSEITMVQKNIPATLKAVPGTLNLHQVITKSGSLQLYHRVLSCFCQIHKDRICECFALKKHVLPNYVVSDITSIPSTSNTLNLEVAENMSDVISKQSTSKTSNLEFAVNVGTHNLTSVDYRENLNVPSLLEDDDGINDFEALTNLIDTDMSALPVLILNDISSTGSGNGDLKSDLVCSNIVTENKIRKEPPKNLPPHKRQASSTTYNINEFKKIRITDVKDKENRVRNNNPSIKTIVSRSLQCFACNKHIKMTAVVKCMVCKKHFCTTCTEGQNYFDYICRKCFGEEY